MQQLNISTSFQKLNLLIGLLISCYVIYAFSFLHTYLKINSIQIFVLIAFFSISKIDILKRTNILLLLCSGLFLFAYYKFHVTSFLYLSLIILIIETINAFIGRMNFNAYLLLIICSPIFDFASTVFGFPLRLQLSKFAGYLVSFVVNDVVVVGNLLRINGTDFTADHACAGLNMIASSLVFTLLLIEVNRKKSKKEISALIYVLLYSIMLALNLFSNIFRIFLLTIFKVFPESNWHEYIGIICFIIYTLLPIYWLISKVFSKYGKSIEIKKQKQNNQKRIELLLFIIIILFGTYSIKTINIKKENKTNATLTFNTINNYDKTIVDKNITKYSNTEHLIYVKPLQYFYSSEHNPLICWTGCGYVMKEFEEKSFKNHIIYFGKMVKDKDEIHTAWYYTDGTKITNSQWQWRWNVIKDNKNYYLVNVSANNPKELDTILSKIIT